MFTFRKRRFLVLEKALLQISSPLPYGIHTEKELVVLATQIFPVGGVISGFGQSGFPEYHRRMDKGVFFQQNFHVGKGRIGPFSPAFSLVTQIRSRSAESYLLMLLQKSDLLSYPAG